MLPTYPMTLQGCVSHVKVLPSPIQMWNMGMDTVPLVPGYLTSDAGHGLVYVWLLQRLLMAWT